MSLILASGPGLESGVANEQCKFTILPQTGSTTFDPSVCAVAFEGPSKPEIQFINNPDGTVSCVWTPKLPGNYKIFIRYEDKEQAFSPFTCKVTGGEEQARKQVAKIKCSGQALQHGRTGITNEITLDTRESGIIGGLSVSMEGPAKPELSFKNDKPGILVFQYKPETKGEYKLNLKFGEIHLPGSPFSVKVT
ncbi:filamin-B-like [Brevipalpus obovatus]|uniref:filamin-B-like n=1 Tax=Brevipalpus obovatus TaxID=246614 RepID=UPI003D9E9D78